MKKEELMYGNKLLFLNEVVTFSNISQIREDGIFWIKTIESKIDSKSFHFKPIPITEEWLLKFGFFVENFDYSIPISECKVVWLTLIPQDEECTAYSVCVTQTDEDEDDQNVFLSDIIYVHQVQNLYFTLTGTHLTLK